MGMKVAPEDVLAKPPMVSARKSTIEDIEAPRDTLLIRCITAFYRRWAYIVSDFSIPIIVVCTIITLIGTAKVATTPNENDITGYTPYGARARDEFEVSQEFFSSGGTGVSMFFLAIAKDEGNMLRPEMLQEVVRVEEEISTNFTLLDKKTQKQESYREFCYSFCQINEPLVQFVRSYMLQQTLSAKDEPLGRIELEYPISTIYGQRMNIQPNFFGIEFYNDTLSGDAANTTALSTERRITNMKSVKVIALQLRSESKPGWTTQEVKDYELAITDYFMNKFTSDHIRVLTLSTSFVEAEVVRAGMSLIPFLVVGFGIMACVSSLTTFLSALYMEQVSIHKFSLAIMACICPFMACGTALGGLFFAGVRYGSILCVTPFLVLAIGVDDAYLMIHAWQRVTKKMRKHPTEEDCSAHRLAEVLADTGPAVIISALTNILADLVGTYTGCPEITLLAYGNMACVAVDFVYQITFYAAFMVIAGKFEIRAEKQRALKQRIACGEEVSLEGSQDNKSSDSSSFHDQVKRGFGNFLEGYISFVTNKIVGVTVIALWIAFIVVAAMGITKMEINLTPKKLFNLDSPLQEMDDLRVHYVIPHYTVATLFVNRPGDLSDPARRQSLEKFVSELESLPLSWGNLSTNYFMRDFVEFERTMRENEAEGEELTEEELARIDLNDIPSFIKWPEYEFWRGFIRSHKNEKNQTVLDKFFLTTAYHGMELQQWTQRDEMLKEWREVVDRYASQFNITVFYDDGIYLDMIDNMPTDTWQSAVATLCCMAGICFIFMYDLFTVCVATGIITSIMNGILGVLSLTGTELDPIVMAALIISIGFSVDIPAHVSYHYHSAAKHIAPPIDVRRRLHFCLSSVGFPALQASLSTSLCVLALLLVPIYMSQVFVKTMVLCMTLTVVHSLLLIPCIVALCDPVLAIIRGDKKHASENSSQTATDA